jgi:predicted TIM-barrel fold metal-dependent hydrolase
MRTNNFYDIHFHAMNFSHPNLLAFAKRLNAHQLLASLSLEKLFAKGNLKKLSYVTNLLTVMENDIGSLFMLVEYYLKKEGIVKEDGAIAVGTDVFTCMDVFDHIILVPLLMDFSFTGFIQDTFYKAPPRKPIISQVKDVFSGIADYCTHELVARTVNEKTEFQTIDRQSPAAFEVYPFLGLNTKFYDMVHLQKMMDKYFGDYQGRYEDFRANLGKFTGNIEEMGSNFFSGIKLYPPIGFDPWPPEATERAKVEYLYDYCCAKGIPITVHCDDDGYEIHPLAALFTSPERWMPILSQERFRTLKLNFAHLGRQAKKKYLIFGTQEWMMRIVSIINEGRCPNIYTDFSYVAMDDGKYKMISRMIEENPAMADRLLFGSDFMINLLDIESYNAYLSLFSQTAFFDTPQKRALCNTNPERFLWNSKGNTPV